MASFKKALSFKTNEVKKEVLAFPLGPYFNDAYTIFGILDPLPPCLHSGQIPSTKFMQPPLQRLHFGT